MPTSWLKPYIWTERSIRYIISKLHSLFLVGHQADGKIVQKKMSISWRKQIKLNVNEHLFDQKKMLDEGQEDIKKISENFKENKYHYFENCKKGSTRNYGLN